MNKSTRAQRRKLLILEAIGDQAVYGLDILKRFNLLCEVTERLTPGSLYVTLHRIEEERLISGEFSESIHPEGGNRRKYYRLTKQGNQMLRKAHPPAIRLVTTKQAVESTEDTGGEKWLPIKQ